MVNSQPHAGGVGRLMALALGESSVPPPGEVTPEAMPGRSPNPTTFTNTRSPNSSTGRADTRRGSRSSGARVGYPSPRVLLCVIYDGETTLSEEP